LAVFFSVLVWEFIVEELINKFLYIFYCKSDEMHTVFLCILYYTVLALHVSGAICTHHQEHKLQSRVVGTCDCYGVLEIG
jgi:hypothetical protein